MTKGTWFEADRVGLRKLLAKRGLAHVVYELVSNAWDTGATKVAVELQPVPGRAEARLVVEDDDPNGFANLSHAWTLFAESNRKADVSKRGRFNLGEKLVLACCTEAEIASTTGTVVFANDGRHEYPRRKRPCGSRFTAVLPVTRGQIDEMLAAARLLICPPNVTTTINDVLMEHRTPWGRIHAELPTEFADDEGCLHRTRRRTEIVLYNLLPGQTEARLYELGVPVVTHDCQWDVSVSQKVPLTLDRCNVSPMFLRDLHLAVVNQAFNEVKGDGATAGWVTEAISDSRCTPEAVKHVITERFGEHAVAFDPSDVEASHKLAGRGVQVVPGRSLPKGAWENARRAEVLQPAGRVLPTPKPFSPDGKAMKMAAEVTEAMLERERAINRLARALLGHGVTVQWAADIGWPFAAAYGRESRDLTINLGALSNRWPSEPLCSEEVLSLLIHEFAHEWASDHLSYDYQKACCKLGAMCAKLALAQPELFS